MKKILIVIITFICLPLVSFAADYDIKHFYIDATLQKNGDMDVKELIVLKGTFNGYERDIFYRNDYGNYSASNLENLSISAGYVNNVSFDTFNNDFDLFKEVDYANNGTKARYILTDMSEGIRIRMYFKRDFSIFININLI